MNQLIAGNQKFLSVLTGLMILEVSFHVALL